MSDQLIFTYEIDGEDFTANTRGKQGGGLAGKAQPFPILKRDGEKAK